MLLKIRKKLFGNLRFPSIMSIVFASFKHPKLPISIKSSVTLLQIVYILNKSENATSELFALYIQNYANQECK